MTKNSCRKIKVFPKALFLATTFPKIDTNLIFLFNFYQIFAKFLKNFPALCIFRPNREKLTKALKTFVENILKNPFFCNFLKKIFENLLTITKKLCFSPKSGKNTRLVCYIFKKYAKIMHFLQKLLNFFLTPYEADHLKCPFCRPKSWQRGCK